MDRPTLPKSSKDKTHAPLILLLVYTFLSFGGPSPYLPKQLTWQIFSQTGEVVYSTTGLHTPGNWWPDLTFCFRDINSAYRPTAPNLARSYGFYACPGPIGPTPRMLPLDLQAKKYPRCGGIQHSFCKNWACVTSNDGDWKWAVSRSDSIRLAFVNRGKPKGAAVPLLRGPCSPQDSDRIRVQFTDQGKRERIDHWVQGKQWGMVFYKYGGHAGSIIIIKLKIENPQTYPVGPNFVLPNQKPSEPRRPPVPPGPARQGTSTPSSPSAANPSQNP